MAKCKGCIHERVCVIKAFPDAFENTKWDIKPCDHFKPTADVVPKSEVEELKARLELEQKAHESLKELYRIDTDALVEARRKTEVEVAREIFEEIDLIFRNYYAKCSENKELKLLEPLCQAERFVINEMWHEVAELKKKYTEGNHEATDTSLY